LSGRSRDRSIRAGQRPAASRGSRARQSLWLLGPVLGGGCLSGLPLIVLGLRARRLSWWIAGALYTVAAWVGFVMVGEAELDTPASDWGVGIWLASWLAIILHSVLINDAWLQWRSGYATHGQTPPDLRPPPKAPRPRSSPAGGPPADPAASASGPQLDLNAVTVEQLASLPGLSQRVARRIVREREARGGYLAVADIVGVAELAPHEYARLRDRLTCVPRRSADPPASGTVGRVVDV
jgi:hypothetical protein